MACYVAVALTGLQVAKSQTVATRRMFWLCLSCGLAFLALNKQLDLQSALTAFGRCHAQATGWYDARRTVQLVFIAVLLAGASLFGVMLWTRLQTRIRVLWPAILGISFLLAFIAIRAVGFHHFDQFIGVSVANMRMNWLLELSGLACIALGAAMSWRYRAR